SGLRVPARLLWAADVLSPAPDERLLEIGCGTGVLARLVAERLTSGSLVAVDRSPRAIARAQGAGGNVRYAVASFPEGLELRERFDTLYGFNVTLFAPDADAGATKLKALLRPSGRLLLFHQPPVSAKTRPWAETTARALEVRGFTIEEVLFRELAPAPAACVIARPIRATARRGGPRAGRR
ncbi:MAG: class I SAM-dependent methyltransferase, partial [Myxococcales bacterium]